MPMSPKFIHLRVHTEYSLIDGLVKIKPLIKKLTELQMPAVAITDHVNLFGLVKMYKTATSQGIKPIAGSDVLIFNSDEPDNPYRLTLLAQNHKGYVTLTELVSQAYQHGQSKDGVPMIRREWIEQNHDGLIALSGAMQGDIGRALVADKKDASLITIMEVYANLEAYQSHILTPHFKKYKDTVKNMVLSLELIDTELVERVHKPNY